MNDNLESELEKTPTTNRFGKMREWLRRYGPAEIIGTVTAYISFFIVQDATDSNVAAAYAGTMGENIGFYGTMIAREVAGDMKIARREGRRYSVRDAMKTAGKLITEFGHAETLDSLVIRPTTMGFGSRYLGRGVGVVAGKIAADVSFYVPTVISYELRKRFLKSNSANGV